MTQCPPNETIRLPLSGRFSPLPLTFPTKSVQPDTTPMAALRSFYMFPKNIHPSWAVWYISKSCTIFWELHDIFNKVEQYFESCMIFWELNKYHFGMPYLIAHKPISPQVKCSSDFECWGEFWRARLSLHTSQATWLTTTSSLKRLWLEQHHVPGSSHVIGRRDVSPL